MSHEEENARLWEEFRAQHSVLIEVRTMLKETIKNNDDHELRIRKLEERKFPLPTVAVLISVVSVITTVVLYAANK